MHHLPSRYIPCDGRLTASAYFKSTLPAWGATLNGFPHMVSPFNFNPRSPHGERPEEISYLLTSLHISIQSLPAWGGTYMTTQILSLIKISIHAPRMGSDIGALSIDFLVEFQSTLPAWGATSCALVKEAACIISIHAPRMGSDLLTVQDSRMGDYISIHAPRMGSDDEDIDKRIAELIFQSTLPAWGATIGIDKSLLSRWNFNPRSPHGERPLLQANAREQS